MTTKDLTRHRVVIIVSVVEGGEARCPACGKLVCKNLNGRFDWYCGSDKLAVTFSTS